MLETVTCARCGKAMKRGEYRRQYGTTPAHQTQYFLVHKARCQRQEA